MLRNLQALDRTHLWHPYTRRSASDQGLPVIARGEGPYLYDVDGRRYLDATSSWWCNTLGHSHPRLVDALARQAQSLQHCILGNLSHEPAIRLASELAAMMPTPDRHVHFCGDGSSAVEAAMKVAVQHAWQTGRPEKCRLAALKEAYHGDTLATLSLGFIEVFHRPFGRIRIPVHQVPVPPYDTDEASARQAASELFDREGDSLAALLVEPLCQGAAGMRFYSADFLAFLAQLAKEHQVMLILDEIATGFGRTGSMFAFQQAGIDPDIVCVGKGLSGGMLPISGLVVKDSIYEGFSDSEEDRTFYHGHTFAGNPLAAAVSLEALALYREKDPALLARLLGKEMFAVLQPLETREDVREVRMLGGIAAVELAGPEASARARKIQGLLLEQGLLMRPLGPVLYLMPPLACPLETAAEAAAALREAVQTASTCIGS